jgi:quinone-modifying oxidoreductase subunit QmoC
MSDYMDHSPRALNAMLLAGRSEDVLRGHSIWSCTSCYACTVECPKQLPVTETIYALRRASMRGDLYPRRFATPILVRRFVDLVDKRGRSSEFWVSLSLTLRTRPALLLEHAPLALRLLRKGRMRMRHDSMREPAQIHALFAALEAPDGDLE